MKHNKSFWYAASLQNQFSHISHFEPKFSVNLQMSRALGRFRRWTLDGSDCIFMGDVLTAECWIIDRRWTASTVSLRPRMCRRLPSELLGLISFAKLDQEDTRGISSCSEPRQEKYKFHNICKQCSSSSYRRNETKAAATNILQSFLKSFLNIYFNV